MAHRLEVMAKDISNAKLFDELVRDLRCISLKMPEERMSAEQRKEKYSCAASIIGNNPRVLRALGPSLGLGDYGLMDVIAKQDDYADGPEVESLRNVFRTYNQHYLNRFQQAR